MFGNNARFALRMRVSMSEIGSTIKLPARFRHSRDQARQRGFTERQARTIELANIPMPPPAHRAAIHQARRARVARQLGQSGVIFLRLQLGAERGIFLYRLLLALVALKPCFFCHITFLRRTACPSASTTRAPLRRSAPRSRL